MKEQGFYPCTHQTTRFVIGTLVALVGILSFLTSSPHSTAQKDDRQLEREQTQPKRGERHRIALVIGNGTYQNVKPLKNPPNDATLLAATLKKLGFDVTVGTDKSQREMKQLIREFGHRLRGGGGVGLFYFAGHGVQVRGHNYLIPVDADIQTEADLEDVAGTARAYFTGTRFYVAVMLDSTKQNLLGARFFDSFALSP